MSISDGTANRPLSTINFKDIRGLIEFCDRLRSGEIVSPEQVSEILSTIDLKSSSHAIVAQELGRMGFLQEEHLEVLRNFVKENIDRFNPLYESSMLGAREIEIFANLGVMDSQDAAVLYEKMEPVIAQLGEEGFPVAMARSYSGLMTSILALHNNGLLGPIDRVANRTFPSSPAQTR